MLTEELYSEVRRWNQEIKFWESQLNRGTYRSEFVRVQCIKAQVKEALYGRKIRMLQALSIGEEYVEEFMTERYDALEWQSL